MQIPSVGAGGYVPPSASPFSDFAAPAPPASKAEQDFANWAKMSPAEQMRQEVLRELGVSEDDLKAMSPQDRAKIEEKIKELTREKVQEATEKKTGVAIDIKV